MERISTAALLLLALTVPALCQIHLGPQGTLAPTASCYRCEGHGPESFPECLNHPHDCHHDEVCTITYGHGDPRMNCMKAHDCQRETANPTRNCTGGGVEVHHNECKKCCADPQCTNDIVELLKLEYYQSPHMMCPGECRENDIQTCIDKSKHCTKAQFCQVSKEDGWVEGECLEDHEWHHCSEELQRHSCDHPVGHHGPHGSAEHHGRCFWDCCDTLACLDNHFGSFSDLWTAKPAMTTTPAALMTTTQAPGPGASLWERLHGDCADQLVGDGCKQMVTSADICHDHLALSICPKTCGLCDAINSTVCKDSVVNDGCKDLAANEDVCNHKNALFLCPNTCNMCDELLNSVVSSIVDMKPKPTGTMIPATTVNPSDFPTYNCDDLKSETCGTLEAMCATSLVKVVCPDICATCMNPIVTGTVGMVVTMPTTAMPMPTTAAPMPTTADMQTTTQLPMPASTMAPTQDMNVSTSPLCSDHLNGMNCSDLKDVCQSVMALSVCPKFCGLC